MLGVFAVVVVHESGAADSFKVRRKTNHLSTGAAPCDSYDLRYENIPGEKECFER